MGEERHARAAREYHQRWLVRGHWRQQAHGPGRTQRRATWIDPYIKGPPEASLALPQWTVYKVSR